MTNPQDYLSLVPIVEGAVYLLAVMLTTVLTGKMVKIGHGYGTAPFLSRLFQNHKRLFVLFIIEAIILSVGFPYMQSAIDGWLWQNIVWFPAIIVEAFVIYYVWFCFEFGFDHQVRWYEIALPQLIVLANYAGLFPLPFKP